MQPSLLFVCFVGVLGLKANGFQAKNLLVTRFAAEGRSRNNGSQAIGLGRQSLSQELKSFGKRIRIQTYRSSTKDDDDEYREDSSLSKRAYGFLVLLTVPLAWGTYVPVVRYLYEIKPPVPGFVFSACYYFVAASTLLTITWAQQQQAQAQKDGIADPIELDEDVATSPATINQFPLIGGLELGTYLFLGNGLQVLGLKTVPSDRAGFLVQLTTVMVPLVQGALAGNLLSIPVRTWVACAIAFSGVLVMGADGIETGDLGNIGEDLLATFSTGDLLIVLSAFVYTMHVVRLGKYAKLSTPVQLGASKATVEAILSSGLVLALMAIAGSTPSAGANGLLTFASESGKEISAFFDSITTSFSTGSLPRSALLPAVGAILWTGWVTCAYTITAQTFGQSRVTATEANLIYSVQPLFTAAFAYVLLGETLSPLGVVGGGLIAGAVYIVASAPPIDDDDDVGTPTLSALDASTESNHPLQNGVDSKSVDEPVLGQIER